MPPRRHLIESRFDEIVYSRARRKGMAWMPLPWTYRTESFSNGTVGLNEMEGFPVFRALRGEFLTQEILPGLTPYFRWARTPLGSLELAGAGSALCGLFLHQQGFVVLLAIGAVTILGLVWPWLSVCGLGGSLSFTQSRCREGDQVSALLSLRNRAPWGAWGVSVECGRGNNDPGPDDDLRTGLAYVPGCCSTERIVDFIPRCRGSYPRRPPRIVCGFPFGLWSATRPLVVGTPLLVWPRTFAVGPIPDVRVGHSDEGLANRDRAGDWGDPLGVRPYRRGDRFRHIHWTQTAQHGELMVCEVQASAAPRVLIVLDARPEVYSGRGPSSSLEWAIRVAASLAEGWISQGARVDLLHGEGSIPDLGGSIKIRTRTVLDALARLTPGNSQDLASFLNSHRYQGPSREVRVVVTTDLGLQGLATQGWRRPEDRFVVLRVGAFGSQMAANDS